MPKNRAKTIKGLSIACVILSGLYMLAFVIGGVALGALIEYYDPIMDALKSNASSGSYGFHYDLHSYSHAFDNPYYDYDFDYYDDIIESSYLLPVMQFGMIAIVIGFIMQAVSLVAAIIMLINSSKPEKLGMSFGWGLAGAILSVLSGGIVQTVLFVLAIVFIYKDQQLYKSGQYPMPYPQAPVASGPVPAAPAPVQNLQAQPPIPPTPNAGAPQPQQTPVAEAAPVQPAQPADGNAQNALQAQDAPQTMDAQSEETIQVADEILNPPVVEETTEVIETFDPGEGAENPDAEVRDDNQI